MTMLAAVIGSCSGGFIVGLLFFAALERTVNIILAGGHAGQAVFLYVARFLAAGAVFFLAAQFGPAALAAAVLGFTASRFVRLRGRRRS